MYSRSSVQNTALCMSLCLTLCGCYAHQSLPAPEGAAGSSESTVITAVARPSMVSPSDMAFQTSVTPSVPDYTVANDFSNVINVDWFHLSDAAKEDLRKHFFAVGPGLGYEFHELYEENRYSYKANFVTTDSLLHAFHLYYAYLQKNAERQFLRDRLKSMSEKLLAESRAQYETLQGTPFESAAQRNIDVFSVACVLAGDDADLSDSAAEEVKLIEAAAGQSNSPLFSTDNAYLQDYTQFKPRGYYTEGEDLESYFRTMMWYGQMNFTQREADLDRSALLAALAIDKAAKDDWEAVYQVTAFLAGESDDNGYYEYIPLIKQVYGEDVTAESLKEEAGFEQFHALTAELPAPMINSMIIREEEPDRDEAVNGFRIMGQRMSVDAAVLQKLVFRDVEKKADGTRRMLPDALDVPAAFGSSEALKILQETTDVSEYPNYNAQMDFLKASVASAPEETWSSSVAASWLNTLRPVLNEDRSGYPMFMQSDAWKRKNLVTFLGSYTELKHDTVLYAKQILSEMGADGIEPVDDRGYVEPEPEVFGRLANLAKVTSDGLASFNMISEEDKEYMASLQQLADKLRIIAEKELRNELPSDEEFELIRTYGAQLEHLWLRTVKTEGHSDYYKTQEFPAALVTDIATNPDDGICLEIANSNPSEIYVIVSFDGALHLTSGSVYQFYQFEKPIAERMTDPEWREICESRQGLPAMPEWTKDYSGELVLSGQPTLGYARINVNNLNVRNAPGLHGDVTGTLNEFDYATVYETKEADGYTWYRIGMSSWIADQNGSWLEYHPF